MTKKVAGFAIVAVAAAAVWAGPVKADAIDPIAVRQAGLALMGGDFGLIKSVVEAKGDVTKMAGPAGAIAKWAAVMPSLFPAGSDKGHDTKALPEVWSDQAGFQKAAARLGEAATKFAATAKAGDADAAAADFKAIGDACGGCHKVYRAK